MSYGIWDVLKCVAIPDDILNFYRIIAGKRCWPIIARLRFIVVDQMSQARSMYPFVRHCLYRSIYCSQTE